MTGLTQQIEEILHQFTLNLSNQYKVPIDKVKLCFQNITEVKKERRGKRTENGCVATITRGAEAGNRCGLKISEKSVAKMYCSHHVIKEGCTGEEGCTHIITRGPRNGQRCNLKISKNSKFCSHHKKNSSNSLNNISESSVSNQIDVYDSQLNEEEELLFGEQEMIAQLAD